jgi:excisionase family DNA binding protein
MATEADRFIDAEEVARLLGVSLRTVARRVDAGELPAIQRGARSPRLFSLRRVMEYQEKLRREADRQAQRLARSAGCRA